MREGVQELLSRLSGLKKTRSGWTARCPAHDDKSPSLSIGLGNDGRVLLHCHAGCTPDAILSAAGLRMSDLYPPGSGDGSPAHHGPAPKRRPTRTYATSDAAISALLCDPKLRGSRVTQRYSYDRADGKLAFIVLRLDFDDGREKTFRPIHPVGDAWAVGDPPGELPLYQLPEALQAMREEKRIFVVEGEQCADALWEIGVPATTSAHGSKSAQNTDWAPLAGKTVVIIGDNDAPGRKYAWTVARILLQLGCRVKIVQLPGLPEGGDIVDFIEARDSRESDELRAMIEAIVDATSYERAPVQCESNDSGEWPHPQRLPQELPPVEAFDFSLLPEAFRPWIEDIAKRVQCPPDFPAVAAMVTLASVVGRKIGICPRRRDDWLVVPNLWGAVIGRPGILKTPAIQEPLKPLKRLEVDAKQRYDAELKRFEAEAMVAKVRRKLREDDIKKALKENRDAAGIADAAVNQEKVAPVRARYIVNDSTVEKLGELLNENPNSLLVFRDELTGLLRSLDKEGQEGARAFYLEAWNGIDRFTYDRIGRGTIDIEAVCVSILGGIQPGPLTAYLRSAVAGGVSDDGLIQRFQLSVWPDVSPDWVNIDEWPDSAAKKRAYDVIERLAALDPKAVGAERDEHDPNGIPFLRFTDEAQAVFDSWRAGLEQRVRSGEEHPVIESHLAKYRSLVPSLALLIHLASDGCGRVGPASLERAIRWATYLESHARRICSAVISPDVAAAKVLAKRIKSGDLKNGFALRDVYRPCWTGLASRDVAAQAVDILIDLDWLREVKQQTEGLARTRYRINPKIYDLPPDRADKTDKRSPKPPLSALSVPPERVAEISRAVESPDVTERKPGGGSEP